MNNQMLEPRVLIVDDEENMRFTLKAFLNDAGFDVAVAADGESAERLVGEQEFQVALVDRILPKGQNGVDVIRRLKQLNPFCEAILITAYPTFESATDTMRCGTFDYLVKPVRRDCVCRAVQDAAWSSFQKRDEKSGLLLLQSISQGLPVAFAVFGQSGDLLIANAAFQNDYGRQNIRLFSEGSAFVPAPDREVTRADFEALRSGAVSQSQRTTRRVAKDGSIREVREHLFSCRANPLMPAHIVAMYEDGRELKTLEQRLLHADRLTTVGVIAASVMHEIKNSLQAVAGYAQLALVKETVRAAAGSEMSHIVDATRSIDDLCDVVKQMVACEDIEFCPVDLQDALERALEILSKAGVLRTASVSRHYPGRKVLVRGNTLLLQQVFLNLIINAVHAMENLDRQELHAGISCEPETNTASVYIRDTGCGITREQCGRVFEPFCSTSIEKGGSGLGLPIVKQIVELHRGTVGIASVVARGTLFTVTLPLSEAGQHVQAACTSAELWFD